MAHVKLSNALRPREILYPKKLALASPTSSVLSVGIVRSRAKATEFIFFSFILFFDFRWGDLLNLPIPSGRTGPWGLLGL
jgi:hypothetical protein